MGLRSWIFTVAPGEGDLRLDQLVALHTGLSRREAREALKLGGVQVAQRRVRVASRTVAIGTEVRVAVDDSLGEPPDFDLDVVFEDAWLLVLNKPAGLPTQGTQASDRHDLMALLARQRPTERLILCHRLDQGTSGLLVLAKDPRANLGPCFQERALRKLYLARTTVPVPEGDLSAPIGRLRLAKPARFGCSGDLIDPKPSLTRVRPATPEETADLAPGHWSVCELCTGRTHQIRVHLASLGAPILGDGLYGGEPSDQLWLHAWRMELAHPVTEAPLRLEAPPRRFRPA